MKLDKNGFFAKRLLKDVEKEKRRSRERPAVPFIGEKKQMWYFLMNQIDKQEPADSDARDESRN